MEQSHPNPLEAPHDQKRPERRRKEVGDRGEAEEEGACDHKFFFRNFYESFSDKRPENQRGDVETPDEKTNFDLFRAQSRKVNGKGGNEDLEGHGERELGGKPKDEIAGE